MPPANSSPALMQRLVDIGRTAEAAGHGNKEPIYAAACAELGLSRATLLRRIKEVTMKTDRKQRSDAGAVTLGRAEAVLISAMLMESMRKNRKRLMSIGQAVDVLRRNGEVMAARTDAGTGELLPLSDSAIARALRQYGLHPDQLQAPEPCAELRSLHPNHVWQIDASLCVLYYLNSSNPREAGLQIMRQSVFYKNKPANLKRIENDRVWRYLVTDHYSGTIWPHYVLGAESAVNIAEAFIAAIQRKPDARDPMHGVPFILMMDMGSANTSGTFTNLLRRLRVDPLPHAPENARATGQVEKAQDIVERSFEASLRFKPVDGLDAINAASQMWARWFNGTQIHTRHASARYALWQTIREDQLRIAPAVDMCRMLLTHTPELRKVSPKLRVEFGGQGREWDVAKVPGVMVGEKLAITYNPYRDTEVWVVDTDAAGAEQLHAAPLVAKNEAGFAETANVIGEDYRRPAATVADANRQAVELAAMDAQTTAEAEAKRKAKALPFGGRIDPYKGLEEATSGLRYLPRKGTDLATATQLGKPTERLLTRFEAAKELAARGVAMSPERNALVAQWHPEGVPESALDELQRRLTVRNGLRVVGGDNNVG